MTLNTDRDESMKNWTFGQILNLLGCAALGWCIADIIRFLFKK